MQTPGGLARLRLSRALAELKKRRAEAAHRHAFDAIALCHRKQGEAVADPARERCWVTTRRAGKTTGAVLAMLAAALETDDCSVLYLSTTQKRAIKTIWDELLKLNRKLKLGGKADGTRFFLRMPNDSKIHVGGCDTRKEADDHRGVYPRLALVVIDEAQDWKDDLLRYTYASVIFPSLADIGGRFLLMGTPGAPRGFFYEYHRSEDVSFKRWSLFDNPHVKDAQATLEKTMRTRGVGLEDPSIQREFFGEFAIDTLRQIFLYDQKKNGVRLADLPEGVWYFAIGSDHGTLDATAAAVWGWTKHFRHPVLVDAQARHGLGATEQIAFVREIAATWDRRGRVLGTFSDPGGGGAAVIKDLRSAKDFWEAEAAEKRNKISAIRLLRDDLRSGFAKVNEELFTFLADLEKPEWDPDYVGEKVLGHMPDVMDAAIYGYRAAVKLFRHEDPAEDPIKLDVHPNVRAAIAEQMKDVPKTPWD